MCKWPPPEAGGNLYGVPAGLLAADASDGLAFSHIQGWHMFLFLNQELNRCDARILQSLGFQHL